MNVHFKLTTALLDTILADLRRPHPFADERAGFIACKASGCRSGILVLAHTYIPLPDDWYDDDSRFGCVFNSDAMRAAMQFALTNEASIFHVHLHDHSGLPWFSRPDLSEARRFVPDFWNVKPKLPHGTLVLSADAAAGLCWYPRWDKPIRMCRITAVGVPMKCLGRFA
jgi:proteasome lid subunit RPN8/RPN11